MQIHAIPEFDQPTELALEHLKVTEVLERWCQNSRLPNVRFLRIYYMEETCRTAQDILSLGIQKLESLYLEECSLKPAKQLISGFGPTLTTLSLFCFNGGINFFEIIDCCPNLKILDVSNGQGGEAQYKFRGSNYMNRVPQHLERVSLHLRNPSGVLPRPGAFER